MVSALERSALQDGYVSYPWERRLVEMLSIPSSSSFYSILFLPKASDKATARYHDLEDTLARAHAWINASQASGAPIVFMNIQTESLLTKVPTYLNSSNSISFPTNFITIYLSSCSDIWRHCFFHCQRWIPLRPLKYCQHKPLWLRGLPRGRYWRCQSRPFVVLPSRRGDPYRDQDQRN